MQVLTNVTNMVSDHTARQLASNLGLNICSVTWEDNGRSKGSCWGPCISDMTLKVMDRNLPVIRTPNYEDVTWDVPMDQIPVQVGNEKGEALRKISLREYLGNFRQYLHSPSEWLGDQNSLLREEDVFAIMSAQACFLPIESDGDSSFNVSIFNYQTKTNDPAILSIVVSSNGTSAQIVDSRGSQKLFFNQNGERCSFVGKRVSTVRKDEGREMNTSENLTAVEKEQNVLLVIQVPLKQKNPDSYQSWSSDCDSDDDCDFDDLDEDCDVEDAIISVGEVEGPFREIGNLEIERDDRFPVRVTLQYYKATSNGIVNEKVMSKISQQLLEARNFGMNVSSLVTEYTNRQTEHNV